MKTQEFLCLFCILVSVTMLGTGCVSIVDKNKADGLMTLAVWKADTTNLVNTASASQEKYNTAQKAVSDYITGLSSQINIYEGEWFSQIDLSTTNMPPTVTTAVNDFKKSAGPQYEIQSFDWSALVTAFLQFVSGAESDYRKKSGEDLKAQLSTYEWDDWNAIHK